MVSGIGIPIVDYQVAVNGQNQLLTQFQRSPAYKQAVDYYQANIGKVKTPEDLLKDRRLLTVALSAFQLEGSINDTGILRKLLTEDPTQKTSLAQRLLDPRFLGFAQAFSSLSSDGGASISSPAGVDAVLAGYQTNEYEKWVANNDGDASVRQALYFQRQVTDVVDISNVGTLFTQYQNSPQVSADIAYYKANIGNVNTPNDLLNDPKLLNIALTSYGIDPAQESKATITALLTQDPTQAGAVAQTDYRYYQFAANFGSLRTGSGAAIHQTAFTSSVLMNYQTNSFETALATNSTTQNASLFGNTGATQISSILAGIQRKSGATQAIAYYQDNIGKVRTVDDLLNDPKLLTVALGGFQIDPTKISSAKVKQLLTEDPNSPTSLAQQDPRFLQFAKAFSGLNQGFGGSFATTGAIASVAAGYQTQQTEQRLGAELSQAQSKAAAAASSGTANTPISIYQVLSDPTLKAVVQGALGLPASAGGLAVDEQIRLMTRAGFDVSQLQSPDKVKSLVNRFLANAGQNSGATGSDPNSAALALFGGGSYASAAGGSSAALSILQNPGDNGDGTISMDFSFLLNGSVNLTV